MQACEARYSANCAYHEYKLLGNNACVLSLLMMTESGENPDGWLGCQPGPWSRRYQTPSEHFCCTLLLSSPLFKLDVSEIDRPRQQRHASAPRCLVHSSPAPLFGHFCFDQLAGLTMQALPAVIVTSAQFHRQLGNFLFDSWVLLGLGVLSAGFRSTYRGFTSRRVSLTDHVNYHADKSGTYPPLPGAGI